jgi:hypothetical protein
MIKLLAEGRRWLTVIGECNFAIGAVIFIIFGKCIAVNIVSMLYVSSIYKVMASDYSGNLLLALSYFFIMLVQLVACSLQISWITAAGQEVIDAAAQARKALNKLKLGVMDDATPLKVAMAIDVTIDEFRSFKGVTPESKFTLSKSSTLSTLGLLITYFFVLLQFRVSEDLNQSYMNVSKIN